MARLWVWKQSVMVKVWHGFGKSKYRRQHIYIYVGNAAQSKKVK